SDVVLHVRGDELEYVVRDDGSLVLGLRSQDGDARLEFRGLNVRQQSGEEATSETVLKGGDRTRRSVRGEDQLFRRIVQGVEGVEELLLKGLLALEELDVVDEEHVAFAIATLEDVRRVAPDRVDEFVHERFGRDISHVKAGEVLGDVVPDRLE